MTDQEAAAFVRFLRKHGYRVQLLDNLLEETKHPPSLWRYAVVRGYGTHGLIDQGNPLDGDNATIRATAEGTMDKWRHVPLIVRLPLRGPRKNELLAHMRWLGLPENRRFSVPRYVDLGVPGIPREAEG